MKRSEVVLLLGVLFLSLSMTPVLADNLYRYEALVLEQTISNGLEIIPDNTGYEVSYVDIELDLIPDDSFRQEVLEESFTPEPEKRENDLVLFHWDKPQETEFSFTATSKIRTSGDVVPVTTKVPFPVTDIPLEFQKYLEETANIDTNTEIRHTAFSLANGVTDLYELEFKFAEWVNREISYNLSTLTSEANKPSSWVYENRYGVCDEITNLFISFNRAVGVPARFVSGIAYSELVESNWGNHGWAEVYFPGVGWVPFDVTYEQYGFVDATHIALAKNVDGTNPSVRYATRGHDYEFEAGAIDFSTTVVTKGRKLGERTQTILSVQEPLVGFTSYNLIIAEIQNPRSYYVVEEMSLAKTEGLVYFDELQKRVLLGPKEKKKVYWLVKVDDKLSSKYIYTFPVTAILSQGTKLDTKFSVQQSGELFSRTYMNQFVEQKKQQELAISCETKDIVLVNQELSVACSLSKGTFPNTLCSNNNCQQVNSADDIIHLPVNTKQVGVHTIAIQTQDEKQQTFVTYRVSDIARLEIASLNIPEYVMFDEQIRLETEISKTSLASPTNVTIKISNGLISESWDFIEFSEDKKFDLLIDGETLAVGKNTFTITVSYVDSLGRERVVSQDIKTTMVTQSGKEKLLGMINRFSIEVNKAGLSVSKALFKEEKPQFQRFIVMTITFIILMVLFATVRALVRGAKGKLERKLD